jgi:hypothetical protein
MATSRRRDIDAKRTFMKTCIRNATFRSTGTEDRLEIWGQLAPAF